MQYTIKINTFSTGDACWYVLRPNGTHASWGYTEPGPTSAKLAMSHAKRFIREFQISQNRKSLNAIS